MQIVVEEERVEVCNDQNNMQQIISKGKRTKRQRLPSPLRLAIALPSSTSCSGSGLFDFATTTTTTTAAATTTFSPSASNEFRRIEEEETDEDMANCLILLAQGHYHHHSNKASKSSHLALPNSNKVASSSSGLYLYECKTCNRCFPSFQALGGHRASHKKPKINNNNNNNGIVITEDHQQQKQGVITTNSITTNSFVNDDDNSLVPTTSTTLTLQIPNRALYNSSRNTASTTPTPKSKVHECSICGAEFTSGQALGGHMRRHRAFLSMSSATTTTTSSSMSLSLHESSQEAAKKPKNNGLKLDLNLPASPEDEHHNRESNNKFSFQSKEKVIVFSATSLVDCHY